MAQVLLILGFFMLHGFCNAAQFYSQHGQDQFLYEHFFSQKQSGVFVEFGAHDGVSLSNTCFFEKELNWEGICIEPLPEVFEKLKQNRTAYCIQGCVSEKKGVVDFVRLKGYSEMLSGLQEKYDAKHIQRIESEVRNHGGEKDIIQVQCYLLNDLLEVRGITHVDYLSIDTEGGELDILRSIDFNKFDIEVISVENNYKDPQFSEFMGSKGYVYITTLGTDEIYKKPKVESISSTQPPSFYFLRQFLSPKPLVIEVDAEDGKQALQMSKQLKNSKLLITERTRQGYLNLLKNCKKRKNISGYCVAFEGVNASPATPTLDSWLAKKGIRNDVEFLMLHRAKDAVSLLESSPKLLKTLKVLDITISPSLMTQEQGCLEELKGWLEKRGFNRIYGAESSKAIFVKI